MGEIIKFLFRIRRSMRWKKVWTKLPGRKQWQIIDKSKHVLKSTAKTPLECCMLTRSITVTYVIIINVGFLNLTTLIAFCFAPIFNAVWRVKAWFFFFLSLFQRLDTKSKDISKIAGDITQAVSLSQGMERKKVIQHIRGMYKAELSASRHWQELVQQLTHDR